jgi:glycosyltransferase involved in cell wall biosynthesis
VNCALIISVYKDVAALKAVLNSVLAQSWKDFDVIISQDGDSDCFDELLKTYQAKLRIEFAWDAV